MTSSQKSNFLRFNLITFICCIALLSCQQSDDLANTPDELIVEEHKLKSYPDISTDILLFEVKAGNTEEILAKHKSYREYNAQLLQYNNDLLQPFGYKLKLTQKQDVGVSALYTIYKDDQIYLEKPIFRFSPVSVNESENKFVMTIELSDGSYMLTNETLTKDYSDSNGMYHYPIYVGNNLLTEKPAEDQSQFSLGDTVVFSSSFNNTATISAKLGPWGYDGHWAIEMPHQIQDNGNWKYWGDIILDGKSLNDNLGYEQSFGFAVINNNPFYFYQKDGKIGISFAQKEINTNFDEILHYFCCSAGLLNPDHSLNMVWFFARRDKTWYYVEAYVDIK